MLVKQSDYGLNLQENMIILGDSKDVLPELENYTDSVKCIYIDPPYNNGDLYNHYLDKMSHEEWVNELEIILAHLKKLLSQDGSLWISIDDGNMHYLKILADKVFGFDNFINTIIWQHRTTRENRNIFSNNHEYILVYSKDKKRFKKSRNKISNGTDILTRYKNPDNDSRGPWQSVSAHVQDGHAVASQYYNIVAHNGKVHKLPNGRCWVYNETRMIEEIAKNNIWFGKDGNGVPRIKSFIRDDSHLVTPETLWFAKDVGTTDSAKKHILKLLGNQTVFDTPKPEELIKRIFEICTNEGDLVLDSFLGSGTTATTAHKMKRRYIGIEKQKNTVEYSIERLQKVIDGEEGGISRNINWQSGGGFSFYRYINK